VSIQIDALGENSRAITDADADPMSVAPCRRQRRQRHASQLADLDNDGPRSRLLRLAIGRHLITSHLAKTSVIRFA
jgi:hypothetical protein